MKLSKDSIEQFDKTFRAMCEMGYFKEVKRNAIRGLRKEGVKEKWEDRGVNPRPTKIKAARKDKRK